MNRIITSHADIISLWPSVSAYAKDIGVLRETANMQKHRNRIAPRNWARVLMAAKERGYEQVTEKVLIEFYANSKESICV